MYQYTKPVCTEIIKSSFGLFALIQQRVYLLNDNLLENRTVYYPLSSELEDNIIDKINSFLTDYFISRDISLYPINELISDYSNNESVKLLCDIQILLDNQEQPIKYMNIYKQYAKYKLIKIENQLHDYKSLTSIHDRDFRKLEVEYFNKETTNLDNQPIDKSNIIEKLCIKEILNYSSIIYVTDIVSSKTKNNSLFYKLKARYARGYFKNNVLTIKNFGEEKTINIFYNYNFNCVVWNKINENTEYNSQNIYSTTTSIFNAVKSGLIKPGSLLSGSITKKEVEKYFIENTYSIIYTTPVLWDSIFYEYQNRKECINLIFSLARRKIIPDDEIHHNETNTDYEPYSREESFDDAFGGEDEAYWNIEWMTIWHFTSIQGIRIQAKKSAYPLSHPVCCAPRRTFHCEVSPYDESKP